MGIHQKPAETTKDIHPLLQQRWSPRAFASQILAPDQIVALLEAARWAPSGGNGQPWSFILASRDDEAAFAQALGTLAEGNVPWAQDAPLLIFTVARTIRDGGVPNRTAFYDLGLAVAQLTFQAEHQGLRIHQMAGFSPDKARELFGIPEGHEPVTVLAVGYPGEVEQLSERFRERELAPRTRKPLQEFVFSETWGQPWSQAS